MCYHDPTRYNITYIDKAFDIELNPHQNILGHGLIQCLTPLRSVKTEDRHPQAKLLNRHRKLCKYRLLKRYKTKVTGRKSLKSGDD